MLALVAAPANDAKIELRDVPEPTPQPSEALVDVYAVSVNRGELTRLETAEDGWRPGWDLAGIVIQPAVDGSGPPVGARVLGMLTGGSWSQRVAIPTSHLAELAGGVSFEDAAAIPAAGITALRTLSFGGLILGKRVLITGGAGGVGRFGIQLAKAAGAHVTVFDVAVGRPEIAHELRDLGADDLVHALDGLTGTFDHIVESVGGKSLAAALRAVAPEGSLTTFGNTSREETCFLVNDLYYKPGARIYAFFLVADLRARPPGPDLERLVRLAAAGRLDPQVGMVADWHDVAGALSSLREYRVSGKVVMRLR